MISLPITDRFRKGALRVTFFYRADTGMSDFRSRLQFLGVDLRMSSSLAERFPGGEGGH